MKSHRQWKKIHGMLAMLAAMAAWQPAFGLSVTDGLVVHFDASDDTTLTTNDIGAVTEWQSLVGDKSLYAGTNVYDRSYVVIPSSGATIAGLDYSFLVTENGRQGVKMSDGHYGTMTSTSLMSFGNGVTVNAKTFVFVTRQIDLAWYGAIIGSPKGTNNRLMRVYDNIDTRSPCLWSTTNFNTIWVNGIKDKVSFVDCGGLEEPHVMAAVSTGGKDIETLGASYVSSPICYDKCVLHEVLFYNRVLTDNEMKTVTYELKSKWGLHVATWTGLGGTADWNDAGNWQGSRVPDEGDDVYFNANATVALSGVCHVKNILTTSATPVTLVIEADSTAILDATIGENICLEKRGTGKLTLCCPQKYAGSTTVAGGTLAVGSNLSYAYCNSITGLVAHLDASRKDTISTNSIGELVAWRSLSDNGKSFVGAGEVTFSPEQLFSHENPLPYTTALGHAAVRFGRDSAGNDRRTTFIKLPDEQIKARTFILVQTTTAPKAGDNGGLLGMITGYSFRFYRSYTHPYFWSRANAAESWVNGRQSLLNGGETSSDEVDNQFELSGDSRPNIWVVRNGSAKKFDIIGGQYLEDADHTVKSAGCFIQSDMHEILLYDTALTDEQIETITAVLMKKWDIPEQAVVMADNLFSASSSLTIGEGATVDVGKSRQTFASLSGAGSLVSDGIADIGGSSCSIGAIKGTGMVDINGGVLRLKNLGGVSVTNSSLQRATLVADIDGESVVNNVQIHGSLDIVKEGSGTLSLPSGQDYDGAMRLGGGTLSVSPPSATYATPSLHLDASHPETMETNTLGQILAWNSLEAGGGRMQSGAVVCQDAPYHHGHILKEDSPTGLASAKFGYDQLGNFTGGLFKAEHDIVNRVVFIVSTQVEETPSCGIFGNISNYSNRIGREYRFPCCYFTQNAATDDMWVNGESGTNVFYTPGTTYPNLLVVRRASSVTSEILGGAWPINDAGVLNEPRYVYCKFYLHEMLAYDVDMTDDQIDDISDWLMKKWGVPRQAEVSSPAPYSGNVSFAVTADSTLDFSPYSYSLSDLTFDADGAGALPVLTVVGDMSVTGTALHLLNAANASRGAFLHSTGRLESPFLSVDGLSGLQRVTYRGGDACLTDAGLNLIIR